ILTFPRMLPPHAHTGSATSHVSRRLGCRWYNHDQVIACSGVSHPKIIEVRFGAEPDVFRCHVRRIKHQVRRENASAVLGDRAQSVPAGHHVEEPRFAGILVTAFLISAGGVCLDFGLGLAVCAQLFTVHVDKQESAAAFGVEALRLNGCFCGLYEMPANKTAEAVSAFARFLVASGAENINCGFTGYLGRGGAFSECDLLVTWHGGVVDPGEFLGGCGDERSA